MGLISALAGSASSVLGDQWKEYFYCDTLPADIILVKGSKKVSKGSSNKHGSDNVISNGSVIVVNEGQCMLIVDQGKVVDLCAEPGEYIYDVSTEPSLFYGNLSDTIKEVFANIGKRFSFGGTVPKDQRVYYVNIKEMTGNKYGTPNPVPFRVVDPNIGLDMDISIRCFGEYSYRICNPILFYTNVCGNVKDCYYRSDVESMMKTEIMTALQPAFAKISGMGIRYSALPGHTLELTNAMNEVLNARWRELRGMELVSVGVSSINASKEDEETIKELQKSAVFRNANMAAAHMVQAQAEAMKAAAANQNAGPAMAFMGMNMAQQAGGINAQELFNMGQQAAAQAAPAETGAAASSESSWTCGCGTVNTGKFCVECGKPKAANGWTCSCGTVNKGKFCSECGKPKPAEALLYRCDKCGWEPEDPANPPKFCPECGDPFNDADLR